MLLKARTRTEKNSSSCADILIETLNWLQALRRCLVEDVKEIYQFLTDGVQNDCQAH